MQQEDRTRMNEKVFTVLGWIALFTLTFAIARQLSEQNSISIYLFPDRWGKPFARHGQEGFVDGNYSGSPNSASAPYKLLADVLPSKKEDPTFTALTAKSCFDSDFEAQTEKTGNYIQRTNNYRHAAPDSCSAPLTEMVNSFYQNPVLPA